MQDGRTHRMTDVYARLAPGATPERGAGRAAADRHAAAPGLSRRLSGRARLRHDRDAVEGRAHGQGAADAADPAGDDDRRAGHRVRERRQPDADAAGASRDASSRFAPRSARRRGCCAGSCWPRTWCCRSLGGVLGLGTGGRRTQSPDLVRRPIHQSHRRDRRRRLGARLHDDRGHRDRDVVCVGAAPRPSSTIRRAPWPAPADAPPAARADAARSGCSWSASWPRRSCC